VEEGAIVPEAITAIRPPGQQVFTEASDARVATSLSLGLVESDCRDIEDGYVRERSVE
jgi:hypothetical protein